MRAVEGASPYKNAFDAIRTVGDGVLCQAHIGNTLSNNMGYTFSGGILRRFLETINLCSISI